MIVLEKLIYSMVGKGRYARMKSILLFGLCLCLLWLAPICVAEWNDSAIIVSGGESIECASKLGCCTIYATECLKSYSSGGGNIWYSFESPVDGNCYINFFAIPQEYASGRIYNERGVSFLEYNSGLGGKLSGVLRKCR